MPASKSRLRRVPVQKRSRKRFEAILDAAAQLFATQGFENTTIDGIADAAETSVGSLYQFFPDKLSIFQAMAERCLERSGALFDALITDEVIRTPWPELIDRVIDGYAALELNDPAFRAIVTHFHLYELYEKADDELTEGFIEKTQLIVKAHAPKLSTKKCRIVATTIVDSISATFFFARKRADPEMGKHMIQETKILLRRYLEPYSTGS